MCTFTSRSSCSVNPCALPPTLLLHLLLSDAFFHGNMQWLTRDHGFSLADSDHDGNTSLLFAAWGGHLELIHYLLENGSSLDEQNLNGHSIFLSAANGGRVKIVQWLLTKGFSLKETNNNGDTALLLAAYGGHRVLVERLLELGSSLNDRNGCGFTPLLSAANGGQLEMSRWLLENGSSLNEVDNDGYTSLILAACGGNIDLVDFFLEHGSRLDEKNDNGDTALLLAAYCGHRSLVAWLLDHGSSLAERNKTNMGVLISAANGGSTEVVELLIERIAKAGDGCGDGLESTDEGGYTALLLAAQRGHLEVVQLLAAFGANVQARTTRHDNNAIMLSIDFPEVQKYLELIWNWSPLQVAIDARLVDRVHTLIQAGAELLTDAASHEQNTGVLSLARGTQSYQGARPPSKELELLLKKAAKPWAVNRYALYSFAFRRLILNTRRLQYQLLSEDLPLLPEEIWTHICSLMQRQWFADGAGTQIGWIEPSSVRDRLRWRQRELLNVEPEDYESDDEVEVNPTAIEMDVEVEVDEDEEVRMVATMRARNSTSRLSVSAASGHGDASSEAPELTVRSKTPVTNSAMAASSAISAAGPGRPQCL